MANNATSTQRRQPGRKAGDYRRVWSELAPEDVFGTVTLADLEASMAALDAADEDVRRLAGARSAAIRVRAQRTKELSDVLFRVLRGVESHPDHGDDSPLYRAMGYTPRSERATGLVRKTDPAASAEEPPANEETAA